MATHGQARLRPTETMAMATATQITHGQIRPPRPPRSPRSNHPDHPDHPDQTTQTTQTRPPRPPRSPRSDHPDRGPRTSLFYPDHPDHPDHTPSAGCAPAFSGRCLQRRDCGPRGRAEPRGSKPRCCCFGGGWCVEFPIKDPVGWGWPRTKKLLKSRGPG